MSRIFVLLAAITAIALVIAACGGDDDDTAPTQTSAATAPADGASVTTGSPTAAATAGQSAAALKTGETSKGTVLTDAAGFTLYTFKNDTTPGKSSCGGGCATTWPPVTATTVPAAPSGVTGTFALIARDDGPQQVTYNGQPVYRYAADTAPGDVKGDGVGNIWFAVIISGQAAASPAATAASAGADYGY